MSSSTLADRLLASLKNNRYVAMVVVAATSIIALAQFSGALRELRDLIWPDATRARATYQTLAFDLRTAERTLTNFTDVRLEPSTIQGQARLVVTAADPLCASKKSLAEMGDAATRAEIDIICSGVESFKNLADPQFSADSGFKERVIVLTALARVLAQRMNTLGQKLPPKN